MTVSGFLKDQAGLGRELSAGPTTDFGDVFGAGLTNSWVNGFGGSMQFMGNPLNERNDMLKQKLGKDIYDLTDMRKKYPNPNSDGFLQMTKEANDAVDGVILQGRAQDPDKYQGIKTTAEIKDNARKVAGLNERHMAEMMIRNPSGISRAMGGFTGSVVGSLIDPPNLLTLPLGAGEIQAGLKGMTAARAIMRAAAIDGTVNAAIEGAEQPYIMEWQKQLGHKYGFGDAVENTAMAFVGGAGLSGLIRGAAHGLKRPLEYMGSVSSDVLDRIASNEKIPASVRDAASFMSRQAHIDESAPPDSIKTGEDLKVHRDTAQRVSEDFENYRTQTSTPEVLDNKAAVEEFFVNEKGEPITVYHGTGREFSDFSSEVRAHYFSDNEAVAETYAIGEKGRVIPANIILKNPHTVDAKGQPFGSVIKGFGATLSTDDFVRGLQKMFPENDGVIFKNVKDNKSGNNKRGVPVANNYVVFKPEQIKRLDAKDNIGNVSDPMDDVKPPERVENLDKLPEGVAPEISADRVAIAESDLKGLVDELGDEKIALDDGRTVSIKEFAEEVKGKKALIEAMKTCRIA